MVIDYKYSFLKGIFVIKACWHEKKNENTMKVGGGERRENENILNKMLFFQKKELI